MDYRCNFREAVQWELTCCQNVQQCVDQFFHTALEPGAALFNTASPADLSPSTCF